MGHGVALPPGTTFANEYRIVRPLASGGMGSVYVAEQLSTGKQRALKLMHAELAWDAKLRERFVQEARVGASIDSEHVVEVVGAGVDAASQMPWLAMELLEGLDLAAMVDARGPLPASEVQEILGQLCHALAAAHRAGIVHRDLKPQNVFVARSRQQNVAFKVKVLDFGIAKVVAAARGTSSATSAVGTPLWMAPEQTDSKGHICPATDVWALGLIAFRLLTGRFYWLQATDEGSSMMTLMREVLLEPIVPASVRAAQLGVSHLIPPGFDAWFDRCLQRDWRARYQDAGQAMQSLSAGAGYGPTAGVVSAPSMQSPPATGLSAAGLTPPSSMQASGAMGGIGNSAMTPQPTPRTSGLWIWLVVGIAGVLLVGGVVVVALAVFAVGIDTGGTTSAVSSSHHVAGVYEITNGSNPGGAGRYHGKVTVQPLGAAHQVDWALTAGQDYRGLGVVSGDMFGVGYAQGDYAVAVYEVEGGTLRGKYVLASESDRIRKEALQGPTGLSGAYQLVQSDDGLTGQITVQAHGATYLLVRSASAGGHQGTGILRGDHLVVTWTPSAVPGVVVAYRIQVGALDGKWAPMQSSGVGTELLTLE